MNTKLIQLINGGRIMKVKANNPILCIVVCMLFAGCTDNSIYSDITTEAVCTKRGNNIISLTIEEDGVNYNLYNVELRNDSMATNVFYFDRNNPSYKVVSVLQHSMEKQMINLKPCTVYKVENHSNGDRGYGCFTFKTDSRGKPLAETYKELNTVRDVVSHENETNH